MVKTTLTLLTAGILVLGPALSFGQTGGGTGTSGGSSTGASGSGSSGTSGTSGTGPGVPGPGSPNPGPTNPGAPGGSGSMSIPRPVPNPAPTPPGSPTGRMPVPSPAPSGPSNPSDITGPSGNVKGDPGCPPGWGRLPGSSACRPVSQLPNR
jgi:hypothetical protein